MAFGDFTVDRNSTKYVLGSGGDIISYATDQPAFEFNADGSYKGLLVEPAATNICLQSEDLSTTWLDDSTSLQQASTTETPDGDTSSKNIKLVDTNAGGTGGVYLYQTITVSGGTKYTASAFVKKDQLDWVALQANATGGSPDANPTQYFDLTNGALGTPTAGIQDSTIEAYPNGWYRCSITWTQGAGGTSFTFIIYVAEADGVANVDRDTTSSIFVWGAQVEAGPIATSYIPTTTASVTRVKDDISLTSASSLIGQTEGTLYLEVDWTATNTNRHLLCASDGTENNRMLIHTVIGNELRMFAQAGGSNLFNKGESSSTYSGIQKIAFAYKTDDFELYRNGSSISSETSGSLAALATLTDIDLGQSFDATLQANMWIRAVALFTRRLSDAEAQALTTL